MWINSNLRECTQTPIASPVSARTKGRHCQLCCRELLPTVVFCFSKRRCDTLADSLQSLDMTSGAEKAQVKSADIAVYSRRGQPVSHLMPA